MSAMRLKSYREIPPDFYRWTCPHCGWLCRAWNVEEWVGKATRHLKENNLAVPINLQSQMEDQLCQTLPPGHCEFDDPNRPRPSTRFSWTDVEAASSTFLGWANEGRPLVEQEEAERRAAICANCYLNQRTDGCGKSCREILRRLFGLFLDRKTRVDTALNNCQACKCILRVKVHFKMSIIESHDHRELQALYPSFCWQKIGGVNHRPDTPKSDS